MLTSPVHGQPSELASRRPTRVRPAFLMASVLAAFELVGTDVALAQRTPVDRQRTPINPVAGPGTVLTRPPVLKGFTPVQYAERLRTAQRLFNEQKWAEAEQAYEEVTNAYPYDGMLWRALGQARWRLNDFRGAAEAYVKAHHFGLPREPRWNAADAARAFAAIPNAEEAVRWLRTAIDDLEHPSPEALLAEPRFDAVRAHPSFEAYVATRAPKPATTRHEKWSADLDYFLREFRMLREDIPDWRFDLIRSSAEELRRQIPALTDEELVIGMQQLATLGDLGHNTAPSLFSREALNGRELARLPLDFWLFPEGLYVIGASAPYENLIGSRVETIGGVPADEAVRRAASIIAREPGAFATVLWLAPSYLGVTAVLKRLGLSDSLARADLGLGDRHGGRRQVRVSAGGFRQRPKLYHPERVAPVQPPLYLRRVGESFWFTDLPDGPVYFQFNQVTRRNQGGATNEPISEFARTLRQHLAQPGKDTLIVDLRHNNGGDTYTYPELLRTLIAFDTMPGRRLYVIVGRNTYSAAQNFIVDLDRLTNAVIVGEPTSAPNAGGDQVTINLPYSGAMLGASSTVWALQSPQDTRTSIAPQLPAALTAAEYFSGRDPALEAILAHMRTTPAE